MFRQIKVCSVLCCIVIALICCQKEINFENDDNGNNNGNNNPPVDTAIAAAVFTFIGAPNDCTIDSSWGIYAKGVSISNAGFRVRVNVTTAGKYNVSSTGVNECAFSGSGIFTETGEQSIELTGQGTPEQAGEFSYSIDTPSMPCTFSVTVLDPVAVISDDYFPLTKGSVWSYEDLTLIKDTMLRSVKDTMSIDGKLYTEMVQQNKYGPAKSLFFRKSTFETFEYARADKYTSSLSYLENINDDLHFLDQVISKGATWASNEYTGTISSGQPIMIQYSYSCLENDAIVTHGNNTFAHVYIITLTPYIRALNYAYNSTGEQYFFHYAKGIGLIYMLKYKQSAREMEWRIKDWRIN